MAWCGVRTEGKNSLPRYNFSSCMYGKFSISLGTKLFVFGGVNDQSYLSGEIYYLETDEDTILGEEKLKEERVRLREEQRLAVRQSPMIGIFSSKNIRSGVDLIDFESYRNNRKNHTRKRSRNKDFVSYQPLPRSVRLEEKEKGSDDSIDEEVD